MTHVAAVLLLISVVMIFVTSVTILYELLGRERRALTFSKGLFQLQQFGRSDTPSEAEVLRDSKNDG